MNLLLAIDDSRCSQVAVQTVLDQFAPSTTAVRVLNVIDWTSDLPTPAAFAEGDGAAQYVMALHDEVRRRSRELVEQAIHRLTFAKFAATGETLEGAPRPAILAAATDWPADLIVLGSHGRHGVDRLLFGSVAEHILRHASCAVEVVRGPQHAAAGQRGTLRSVVFS
jgi:nucleotide-binding universal stress UspA family protein